MKTTLRTSTSSTLNTPVYNATLVYLPKELVIAVHNLGVYPKTAYKCLLFLDLLINQVLMNRRSIADFNPLSANYLRKVFNSRYKEWLDKLIEAGIVERKDEWIQFLGISKGYRVNQKAVLYWDDLETIEIPSKKTYIPNDEDLFYWEGLMKFSDSIEIDYPQLYSIMDDEIKGDEYETRFKRYAWLRSIKIIESEVLTAKRSSTNKRLNTNFTNLPKPLMRFIKQSNGLLEIDAKNSQFAILANMIKGEVNDGFVEDAIQGRLYENVAQVAGLSRNEAKDSMFKTIYSKPHYRNRFKRNLTKLYPETVPLLDDYKRKAGDYRRLSIDMQVKESEIYIDGVLKTLYEQGILAISKHDSIIFHTKDEESIMTIIKDTVAQMGYELVLVVS